MSCALHSKKNTQGKCRGGRCDPQCCDCHLQKHRQKPGFSGDKEMTPRISEPGAGGDHVQTRPPTHKHFLPLHDGNSAVWFLSVNPVSRETAKEQDYEICI